MGKVGLYGIAGAGFPKGECWVQENRGSHKKKISSNNRIFKGNQQKLNIMLFFTYIGVA